VSDWNDEIAEDAIALQDSRARSAWLAALYINEVDSKADKSASRMAFFICEHLLSAGEFDLVDTILKEADPSRLTPAAIIAILTMTYHAKAHFAKRGLESRHAFVEGCEARMVECLGEERAERLMCTRR